MRSPRELASRMGERRDRRNLDDGFKRETFTLPREAARTKARDYLDRFPAGGYSTIVESWRELDDGRIEFTMRRLPTAD